ncbi:hypothetical protein CL644_01820 [bacterium]|nr:hypothetical protein [bacterium]|tara:strand:+ start:21325 stop:22095 length:771 start_codon:yes stop_codon:yes gene_type:complete
MNEEDKCWIFGDESGMMGRDRFFAIGILGTRDPKNVRDALKQIREKTNFYGEVSYKSSDKRRALCAIRWMDWFFSGQDVVSYRVIIKDKTNFNTSYFKDNKFKAGAEQLAYCESYREVLKYFADFTEDKKVLIYSQIGLEKMNVAEYLQGKIKGLDPENCFEGNTKEKRPHKDEFTGQAELLQLCDLLTSTTRAVYEAVNEEGKNKCWVKKMLNLNLLYHIPLAKGNIKKNKSTYFPRYKPFDQQRFSIYHWRPRE